jgi:hypothetical protein
MIFPLVRLRAHRRQVRLVRQGRVALAGNERLRRRLRAHRHADHVLHRHAVLLQDVRQHEVLHRTRAVDVDRLALELLDRIDVVAHREPVAAVRLVDQRNLHGVDPGGGPDDVLVDRGRRGVECSGGERRRALHRRDHADLDVDAVLLEEAGVLGELERLEAGPSAHAERDFFLGLGRRSDRERAGCEQDKRENSHRELLGMDEFILSIVEFGEDDAVFRNRPGAHDDALAVEFGDPRCACRTRSA